MGFGIGLCENIFHLAEEVVITLLATLGTLLTMLNYVFDSLLLALEMADVGTPC